jgi:hypothetical protein
MCVFLIPKNEKTSNIDVNRKFQDVWTLKMPWEDPICNEVGLVTLSNVVFALNLRRRKRFWWLNGIPSKRM